MKNLLMLFMLLPLFALAQWDPIHIHTNTGGVAAITDENSLIVAPASGYMHMTYDAGETFAHQSVPYVNEWFSDIAFPSDSIGYAVGGTAFGDYTSIVIKTTDAGQSWELMTANEFGYYAFGSVAFLDSEIGVIAGEVGTLLLTVDGALSFTEISPPIPQAQFTDMTLAGSRIVAGCRKVLGPDEVEYSIFTSDDFGSNWELVYTDTLLNEEDNQNHRAIYDIQFINDQEGFCVGGGGLFLKTNDGGQTWSSNQIVPYSTLTSVYFTSPLVGYVNNIGGIFKTTDGGASWTPQNINLPSIISDIVMLNDEVGYAIGDNIIYKTINGGDITSSVEDIVPQSGIRLYPNPASDVLIIEGNVLRQDFQIRDMEGRTVIVDSGSKTRVDISGLANGTYMVDFLTKTPSQSIQFIVLR